MPNAKAAAKPKTSKTIKLNRDAYGINARASALADFVEVVCLAGEAPTEEDVADHLSDSKVSLPPEKYVLFDEPDPAAEDDDGDEDPSRFADSAARVFALLRERSRILTDRYPFELTDTRIKARKGPEDKAYLCLLAMTVAHAHNVQTKGDPKQLFEEVVSRVLSTRGWKSANLAMALDDKRDFAERLGATCADCDLKVKADGVVISSSARDEGVDTVAHLSWEDDRPGRWTLIGQATFQKSDGWRNKLNEPSPSLFGRLFGEHVLPLAFLAVPHHVEPLFLQRLVQNSQRVLIDRLRLARFPCPTSASERAILDTVLGCAVEYH